MKVAYFLGSLNRGGAESLIFDLCRQIRLVPYDFECVYRHEGNMSEAFHALDAPMVQIRMGKSLLCYLWAIRRTLQNEHITVIHSQTPSNTLLLSFALLGTGIKIVTTLHGYNFSKAPLWQRKIVCRCSDKVLCVSNHQKCYYEQKWHLPKNHGWLVVYNGIDFLKIDSAEPSLDFAEGPRRIRLAMVGNFVSGRSQNIIAKSIHLLRNQGINDFDFYFIGRRDDNEAWRYDECVQYCKEHQLHNVHFLGSRGDVPSLLKSIDGFVYSTSHDTFGIAVIEAISAGLPIIVNDWAVMKEVCNIGLSESNSAIRFFRTDDAVQCAQRISELLVDISENKRKLQLDCQEASSRVKSKYSIQNHINNLHTIYQSL